MTEDVKQEADKTGTVQGNHDTALVSTLGSDLSTLAA